MNESNSVITKASKHAPNTPNSNQKKRIILWGCPPVLKGNDFRSDEALPNPYPQNHCFWIMLTLKLYRSTRYQALLRFMDLNKSNHLEGSKIKIKGKAKIYR
jgi:hypothetical protein